MISFGIIYLYKKLIQFAWEIGVYLPVKIKYRNLVVFINLNDMFVLFNIQNTNKELWLLKITQIELLFIELSW